MEDANQPRVAVKMDEAGYREAAREIMRKTAVYVLDDIMTSGRVRDQLKRELRKYRRNGTWVRPR